MAKDPVCGMFIEETSSTPRYTADGKEYFFCSTNCLNEFSAPEKELKKLKMHVLISIALIIPITILTYWTTFAPAEMQIVESQIINYVLLGLAVPVQFWIGWRFYKGLWDSIKAKASNMDSLIAIGTSAAFFYSLVVTVLPGYFPFSESIY